MGLRIIGVLGNTPYSVIDIKYQSESIVSYNKDNKQIIGSPYSIITILHFLNKYHYDMVKNGVEFIVLYTKQSQQIHFNNSDYAKIKVNDNNKDLNYENYCKTDNHWISDYLNLRSEFEYYKENNVFSFPIEYSKKLIKHDYNENDKWEFFEELYKELAKNNNEIIIDLSNGNRTFPTLIMLTTSLFESIKSTDLVKGVYYINLGSKELVSLSDMYLITKWSSAINSLLNSGSYKNYRNLIKTLLTSYKDPFIAEGIINVSNSLEKVVDALKLMEIGYYMIFNKDKETLFNNYLTYKIYYLLSEIYTFKNNLSKKQITDEILIILKTIDGIEEQFKWFNIKDKLHYNDENLRIYLNENFYLHAYEILQYYKNHEMYQQAITLMREVLFPTTEYVSDVTDITNNSNKGKIYVLYFEKLYGKINKYLDNQKENQEFTIFRKQLIKYHDMRNKINHAFQISLGKDKKYRFNNKKINFNYDYYCNSLGIIKKTNEFNNSEIEAFINNNDKIIKEFSLKINEYHYEIINELDI